MSKKKSMTKEDATRIQSHADKTGTKVGYKYGIELTSSISRIWISIPFHSDYDYASDIAAVTDVEFTDGSIITNDYYNDGFAPNLFPSHWGIFPFSITDTESHIYGDDGVFILNLTVEDDDNRITTMSLNIIHIS
jgi:hypothetical protein